MADMADKVECEQEVDVARGLASDIVDAADGGQEDEVEAEIAIAFMMLDIDWCQVMYQK